jgi:glutathione S-transferase
MSTLKLTYFDAAGRAEAIRIAFALAGIPFEDVRLQYPEFGALKQSGGLPLGSVPVLEVDGVPLVQTSAMLRYAARLGSAGLYPADPLRALVVDSALDTFNDTFSHALTPSFRERDMEKKLAMRAELAAGTLKQSFTYIEGLLATYGGPFFGGESLSIADLVIALYVINIRNGGLDGISAETIAPFVRVSAMTDAYLAEPRIAALAK